MKLSNFIAITIGFAGIASWMVGCGDGITGKAATDASTPTSPSTPTDPITACTTASCVLNEISAAEWAEAEANIIDLTFEKNASGDYVYASSKFTTSDSVNHLVFEAYKPYVLRLTNLASANNLNQEHYFTSPSFYQSIAVEKIVTPTATYYTPYLNDFELNAPQSNAGTAATTAKIYFVPVVSGNWR